MQSIQSIFVKILVAESNKLKTLSNPEKLEKSWNDIAEWYPDLSILAGYDPIKSELINDIKHGIYFRQTAFLTGKPKSHSIEDEKGEIATCYYTKEQVYTLKMKVVNRDGKSSIKNISYDLAKAIDSNDFNAISHDVLIKIFCRYVLV